jgi:hypothetical protein
VKGRPPDVRVHFASKLGLFGRGRQIELPASAGLARVVDHFPQRGWLITSRHLYVCGGPLVYTSLHE